MNKINSYPIGTFFNETTAALTVEVLNETYRNFHFEVIETGIVSYSIRMETAYPEFTSPTSAELEMFLSEVSKVYKMVGIVVRKMEEVRNEQSS